MLGDSLLSMEPSCPVAAPKLQGHILHADTGLRGCSRPRCPQLPAERRGLGILVIPCLAWGGRLAALPAINKLM